MKKVLFTTAVATVILTGISSQPVMSHEAGDWILRVGATLVEPHESSSLISTTATGALSNTAAGVGDNVQLGLNLVYMMTDKVGLELLAATPFEHDLTAKGLNAHGLETTDLGSAKHLPPTLTANYYFYAANSAIRPYLGVGVNFTTFFSEDLSGFARNELSASSLSLDDSWGIAWRGGVDWELSENWMLNASFWKIDLETDASFNSALGKVKVNVDVDPWVYMLSIGYKF